LGLVLVLEWEQVWGRQSGTVWVQARVLVLGHRWGLMWGRELVQELAQEKQELVLESVSVSELGLEWEPKLVVPLVMGWEM